MVLEGAAVLAAIGWVAARLLAWPAMARASAFAFLAFTIATAAVLVLVLVLGNTRRERQVRRAGRDSDA